MSLSIDTMAEDAETRFPSLLAMRKAHLELLQRRDPGSDAMTGEIVDAVRDFMDKGLRSGAYMDDDQDRWAAQSLLDYWSSLFVRAGVNPPDAILADFDPAVSPFLTENVPVPYRGLDAFRPADALIFFGRQALVTEMAGCLAGGRLLAVVGPSGSGKSSAVMAGLIPAVKDRWNIVGPIVPGIDPVTALTKAWPRERASARGAATQDPPNLLVIDQFEEVFTLSRDEAAKQFIDRLVAIAAARGTEDRVVLTLRLDFEEVLKRYPKLAELYDRGRILVKPMSVEELRQAILGPAEKVHLKFEAGLVDALVSEVHGLPGALPLLQFTLLMLWEKRQRDRVTWEEFGRLAGVTDQDRGRASVSQVLTKCADEVYENIARIREDRLTLERIMMRLVRPMPEGYEFTSRRILLKDLYRGNDPKVRIDGVLDRLVSAGLLRITGATSDEQQVEVAHETLVRNWPKLTEFLNTRRIELRRRESLRAAAAQWRERDKNPDTVLRGTVLDDARRYDDLEPLEKEFVEASMRVAEEEEHQKLQYQVRVATAFQLAAESRNEVGIHPHRSVLLALEAMQRTTRAGEPPVPSAITALREALIHTPSRRLVGHKSAVSSVALSVDTRWLASAGKDGKVVLWDLALWDVRADDDGPGPVTLRDPEGGAGAVHTVAFDPKGRWVASGGDDRIVRLWDLEAPKAAPIRLMDHEATVFHVSFSPDGRWLASGGLDGTPCLWDTEENRRLEKPIRLRGHTGCTNALAFSPDGRWLATGGDDSKALLWDLRQPGARSFPLHHHDVLTRACFSPDNRWAATGSKDQTVRLWDLTAANPGADPITLFGHRDVITGLAFTGDSSRVISSGWDERVLIREAGPDRSHDCELPPQGHGITRLAASPDGRWLVTADLNGTLVARDLADPADVRLRIHCHDGSIAGLAISGDSRRLATCSVDASVQLFDLERGLAPAEPTMFPGTYTPTAMGGKGPWLACAGDDRRSVRLLDLSDRRAAGISLDSPVGTVRALAISPDGRWLVAGGTDPRPCLWDLAAANPTSTIRRPDAHQWGIEAAAFSPDSRRFVTGSDDHTARVWDLANLGTAPAMLRHEGAVWHVAFSRDGKRVFTAGGDSTVRIWNFAKQLKDPIILWHEQHVPLTALAISPDGRWLAAGGGHPVAYLWDLTLGNLHAGRLALTGFEYDITCITISPDSRWLAVSAQDPVVYVWDLRDPSKDPFALAGHSLGVRSLSFSPDSRLLATGSDDNTARIWELPPQPSLPIVLNYHLGRADTAFSPDGRWLITGSDKDWVRLWNLNPRELESLGSRLAGRNLTFGEWQQALPMYEYMQTCSRWPVQESVIRETLRRAHTYRRNGDTNTAAALYAMAARWADEAGDVELYREISDESVEDG